ncbi:MAG: ABC transporter substrate-binding protein, partial [Mastigocoleus sp. MO_167.B18]|nr:ABC transporter substrate-binding protein [Mastigocoleus sp. MO_167.B18]
PEVLIYYNNAKAREKGNALTIAAVLSTDNAKDVAQGVLRGVAQAQNQFNDNNGLSGRLLEIVIANDSNEKEKAEQVAKQLLKDKSILGVIGHNTSDATEAALDVYKQSNISVISPTSASNELKDKVFFRTVPSNAASSKELAEYTTNSKFNKVAVFYNPNSVYSKSLKEKFAKNFKDKEKFKGQIIREINLTDAKLNIEQELKNIASQQVQAIMLFPNLELTSTAREIAKVNAKNNLGLKLITGSALYDKETVSDVNFEGLVLTIPWFGEKREAQDFFNKGEQQWGGAVNWFTATSYDATQAILKAIAKSFPNPSRKTVLQELPTVELGSKETSGYPLQFKDGERKSPPILVEVKNGRFQLLKSRSK